MTLTKHLRGFEEFLRHLLYCLGNAFDGIAHSDYLLVLMIR